jgi:hypothetical protein
LQELLKCGEHLLGLAAAIDQRSIGTVLSKPAFLKAFVDRE